MLRVISKDTKFGYGFLLAGVGLPYLIEQLFGALGATIIAAACTVIGLSLLIAGHLHRDAIAAHRSEVSIVRRGFVTLLILAAIATLSLTTWRLVRSRHRTLVETTSPPQLPSTVFDSFDSTLAEWRLKNKPEQLELRDLFLTDFPSVQQKAYGAVFVDDDRRISVQYGI